MASADLREELNCSICLSLYKEPISLKCGHNFCRDCIVTVLDTQEICGNFFCPECRDEYTERPSLEKNRKLCNIVEHFRSAHQEDTEVLCTYCDFPVPASKTCLHCEASFCEKHLKNHSKAGHHLLFQPTKLFEDRKCSTHQEILKYYCTEDRACICTSCWVAGDHRGHQVELLNEAAEKKCKDATGKLSAEKQKTENTIQDIGDLGTCEKAKAAEITENIGKLFKYIKEMLDDVEKRVLTEISRQEEQISQSVSDLIRQLERQKDDLSRKINEIQDLHKITDPLTFLKKELIGDYLFPKNGDNISDLRKAERMDGVVITKILHTGLLDFTDRLMNLKIERHLSDQTRSNILLDIKTASNYIRLSKDLKSASCNIKPETRPDDPERFKARQVISTCNFSIGKHYWEVDVSAAKEWLIGVADHSIERKTEGAESYIGYNDKSWGLAQRTGLQARHKNLVKNIDSNSSLKTVGIYLDYEAGRLSFYQLCDPIRHLHTFITDFKEPLHAAFYVFPKSSIRIIK